MEMLSDHSANKLWMANVDEEIGALKGDNKQLKEDNKQLKEDNRQLKEDNKELFERVKVVDDDNTIAAMQLDYYLPAHCECWARCLL